MNVLVRNYLELLVFGFDIFVSFLISFFFFEFNFLGILIIILISLLFCKLGLFNNGMFFLDIINVFLGCVLVGIFKFINLFIVGIFIVVFNIVFIYEILVEI